MLADRTGQDAVTGQQVGHGNAEQPRGKEDEKVIAPPVQRRKPLPGAGMEPQSNHHVGPTTDDRLEQRLHGLRRIRAIGRRLPRRCPYRFAGTWTGARSPSLADAHGTHAHEQPSPGSRCDRWNRCRTRRSRQREVRLESRRLPRQVGELFIEAGNEHGHARDVGPDNGTHRFIDG